MFRILEIVQDSLGMASLTMISKKVRILPGSGSARSLVIGASVTGFILMTMFKTMLGALMTVDMVKPPINEPQDLLSSSLKLLVLGGSNVHTMFKKSKVGSVNRDLYDQGIIQTFNQSDQDVVDHVRDQMLDHGNLLFWDIFGRAEYLGICPMGFLFPVMNQITMVFPLNSSFKDLFNHNIVKHQPMLVNKIKEVENQLKIKAGRHAEEALQLGLPVFTPALLLVGFGLGLSGLVCLIEIMSKQVSKAWGHNI